MENKTTTVISVTATKKDRSEPVIDAKVEVSIGDENRFHEVFARDVPELVKRIDDLFQRKLDQVKNEAAWLPEGGIGDDNIDDAKPISGEGEASEYGPAVYSILGYCVAKNYLRAYEDDDDDDDDEDIWYTMPPVTTMNADSISEVAKKFNRYTRLQFAKFLGNHSADDDIDMVSLIKRLTQEAKEAIYES